MRTVVALNPDLLDEIKYTPLGSVEFGGLDILFGIVDFEKPKFDKLDKKNDDYVLIRVDAFSCNYRDKGMLVYNYQLMRENKRLFLPFGSEFCGTVMEKGRNVCEFQLGEKVIPDCGYEDKIGTEASPGVVTNFASLGWLKIHKQKLVKKPDNFDVVEGACFSLGAQTAASMISKSGILESNVKKPVVFSAGSATSIFLTQQLMAHGIEPLCISSKNSKRIFEEGVLSDGTDNIDKYLYNASHAFDPFFDINILNAVSTLMIGGKYIYCGILEQHPLLAVKDISEYNNDLRGALELSIIKNVSIIGNCLGKSEDLRNAIKLYKSKNIKPIMDKVFSLENGIEFIKRSFLDRNKTGKCVMKCEV